MFVRVVVAGIDTVLGCVTLYPTAILKILGCYKNIRFQFGFNFYDTRYIQIHVSIA